MSRMIPALAIALAALVGCESVESTDVLTSGLYADLSATADGSGTTRTEAVLRVGGGTSNTYLALAGDDTLSALETASGTKITLDEHNLGDIYHYWADFDVDAEDSEFVISFERTIDDGAPDSNMTLPAPFDITGPDADANHSRAADLTVGWEPSGSADPMAWEIVGECFHAASGTLSGDSGSVVVPAGSLQPFDGEDATSCEATLTVSRARAGNLDPGYGEGGKITGRQVRQIKFRSDP